jgi:hypothetical protein
VTITEVTDPTLANMVIDTGTPSACGGMSNGVLGCFNAPNSEITLIQGWNWYAGSDPTRIGSGQYDFETTVLHELGHALGLGGSTNTSSPMYETLAAGVANRTVSTQDLNIPDPPSGADPQMAAGFDLRSAASPASQNFAAAFNPGPAGVAPMLASGVAPTVFGTGAVSLPLTWTAAQAPISAQSATGLGLVLQGTDRDTEHGPSLSLAAVSTVLLEPPSLDPHHWPAEPANTPPLTKGRNGRVTTQPPVGAQADPGQPVWLEGADRDGQAAFDWIDARSGQIGVSALDALAADVIRARRWETAQTAAGPALRETNLGLGSESAMVKFPSSHSQWSSAREAGSLPSRVAAILLAAGFVAYRARTQAGPPPGKAPVPTVDRGGHRPGPWRAARRKPAPGAHWRSGV